MFMESSYAWSPKELHDIVDLKPQLPKKEQAQTNLGPHGPLMSTPIWAVVERMKHFCQQLRLTPQYRAKDASPELTWAVLGNQDTPSKSLRAVLEESWGRRVLRCSEDRICVASRFFRTPMDDHTDKARNFSKIVSVWRRVFRSLVIPHARVLPSEELRIS